jgi:hypothetical protein
MPEKSTEEPNIEFTEAADGSVVATIPDGIDIGDDSKDESGNNSTQDANSGDSGDEQDHPDDSDAVRAARRARRRAKKDLIRKTNEEKDIRLVQLQRQNEEMANRLAMVERKTQGYDNVRLEKAMEDAQTRYEYAKMKLSEAASSNDGEALVEAQELMYQSRSQVEELRRYQKQGQTEQRQPQEHVPDPTVQNNAVVWMKRNPWYKTDISDEDSKIAKIIDEGLVKEGYDPKDPDYWDELDNRLQKKIPHRYNAASDTQSERKPRNMVGSSGREASGAFGGTNRTFTLNPEQVRAMKDAGMWDDPVKRQKMIKRYAIESRTNRG